MNPKVDEFIAISTHWQAELKKLRAIILDCMLTEEFKWSSPVYTYKGKNVVGLGRYKEYCGLGFFKGALLNDSEKILKTPGSVQTGRLVKFKSVEEIIGLEKTLKAYIYEAIEVEKAGLQVKLKTTDDFIIPYELQAKLDEMPALKTAFDTLTPGRQRGYLVYFAQPKQSKTRTTRVEKYIEQILRGKGLTDR